MGYRRLQKSAARDNTGGATTHPRTNWAGLVLRTGPVLGSEESPLGPGAGGSCTDETTPCLHERGEGIFRFELETSSAAAVVTFAELGC